MSGKLTISILLLFHFAWSVQILGSRESGTRFHLQLNHVPATEHIGAFKVILRTSEVVDISSVTTDAATEGAWSQIKPVLSRSGNQLTIMSVGPALKRSRTSDTLEMCRISLNLSAASAQQSPFNGIIDSIWFEECLDVEGANIAPAINKYAVSLKRIHHTAADRASIRYSITGRVHSFSFLLSEDEHVKALVVNAQGKCIAKLTNKKYKAGLHTVRWPTTDRHIPTGMYFMQLEIRNHTYNKKVMYYR